MVVFISEIIMSGQNASVHTEIYLYITRVLHVKPKMVHK